MLPTWLTFKLGDSDGYMTLGLLFLPILVLFSLPTLIGPGHLSIRRSSTPSATLHRLLRPAQEPPVPRLLLVFVVNGAHWASR